ncbi:MAG: FGGY-family carbohydrate kinase [Blautia sp.]|nr:FGGY-family carbohydrate kinase [Blautia sp.]
MNPVYLLAVDLGTSFIKAAVYDTEGNCLGLSKEEVHSDSSVPGVFIQHGEEIFESVLSCIRTVTDTFGEKSAKIAAIGFTGQMAGFMGVDEEWRDITTWSCSLDTRYLPYADRQMEKLARDFLETGGTNSPLMAPKCAWFIHEYPEKARLIKKYMLISSYVIGKLGKCRIEEAALGSSYATWTGLADIKNGVWSEEICGKAGISAALLPRIAEASEICGYLDAAYASRLGLSSGIPLIAGAGDKVAGCVGSGILWEGDTIFETSSYGALSCLQREYHPNKQRKDYDAIPACTEGMFYLHRYLPGSGITLKWFMDTFGESFTGMEPAAAKLPCGSEGLLAVGFLGGSAQPLDGSLKGAWVGYTWSHRKEHFYRALLESYAYELKATLDSIAAQYPEWDRYTKVHVIGGGAVSDAWMHILADVTGSEMICHEEDDFALWGAAVLAGKGIGIFESPEETVRRLGKEGRHICPDEENHRQYLVYAEAYEALKEDLKPTYQRL